MCTKHAPLGRVLCYTASQMAGERRRILLTPQKDTLTSEQRAGFLLVAVTGFFALIIGGFYMVRTLHKPFDISYEGPLLLSPSEERALEVEQQKIRDTDGDSLTDYDELYTHRSSPYLADTDGDGIGDAAELQLGSGVEGVSSESTTVSRDEFIDTFGQIFGSSFYVPNPDVGSLNAAVQGGGVEDLADVTPEFLREALRSQGATEDQLRYLTDQQLIQRYLELLKQYQEIEAQEQSTGSSVSAGEVQNPPAQESITTP